MSYRRNKTLDARDKCIVRLYYERLQKGDRAMDAICYCAEWYDLSESQVMRIIQKDRNTPKNSS